MYTIILELNHQNKETKAFQQQLITIIITTRTTILSSICQLQTITSELCTKTKAIVITFTGRHAIILLYAFVCVCACVCTNAHATLAQRGEDQAASFVSDKYECIWKTLWFAGVPVQSMSIYAFPFACTHARTHTNGLFYECMHVMLLIGTMNRTFMLYSPATTKRMILYTDNRQAHHGLHSKYNRPKHRRENGNGARSVDRHSDIEYIANIELVQKRCNENKDHIRVEVHIMFSTE